MALLTASPPNRLPAQVGYPPDHSAYRDIKPGSSLVVGVGYLAGGRGIVGVGPSHGRTVSARFERPFSRVLSATLAVGYAQTSRLVADPTQDSASKFSGPFDNGVYVATAGMQFLLTGAKTWHGLAPFVGVSVGVAISGTPPADSSGYRFRPKPTFGPQLGVRWYLARRLSLRADTRLLFWKLAYPLAYKQPSPDGSRVLSLGAVEREWTRHPWISVGLGWTF
jgi:hypothetical protein